MSAQAQFNSDFGKLNDAAKAYAAAEAEQKQAEEYYHNVIIKKLDGMHSASQILAYLVYAVFQNEDPGANDAKSNGNVFGLFNGKLGIYGHGLSVNNYLTQVHDDLQKMTTSGSDSPQEVKDVAEDLDKLLDDLKNNKALISAMDPETLDNLRQADLAFRQQFYIQGDTSGYNPDINNDPTGKGGGYTYHFYVGNDPTQQKDYITSFAEMEKYMKSPGDNKGATEAYKSIQDQVNSAVSMTQTINTALNEQINQLTNFIKTLVGFYENGLCQPWMKLANVSVQNQKTG